MYIIINKCIHIKDWRISVGFFGNSYKITVADQNASRTGA